MEPRANEDDIHRMVRGQALILSEHPDSPSPWTILLTP